MKDQHGSENHSPVEKPYVQQEELMYSNTGSTVSPVSVPAVVPIPRVGYVLLLLF